MSEANRIPLLRGSAACLSTIITFSISATTFGDSMLTNSDFSLGHPGEETFGWTLELAEGQLSECSVVEGRRPGSRAARIYNDELGESCISQEIAVRSWRWYVAEVWVNSAGMRALGFAPYLTLEGGRGVSGSKNFDDAWEPHKTGWHALRMIEHSMDADHLTLKLGGKGWSGEMLFADPVVREVSQVEATRALWQTHHPTPTPYEHHMVPWQPGAEQGQFGFAFHKHELARVAPDYPNSFTISGRFGDETPEGRITLWLPVGVRFRKVQWRAITPKVSSLVDGSMHVELPPGKCEMVLDSDLEVAEVAIGYVQYEWKGGSQLPMPIVFKGVEAPQVAVPERLVTMVTVSPETVNNWEDGPAAMAADFRRFGFARLEVWGRSDVRPYYDEGGLWSANEWSPGWTFDAEKHPEARAVKLDGSFSDLMCPSYRGEAFTTHVDNARESARYASALSLDDEWYAMRGEDSPVICFDERCMERWEHWVREHEPNLEKVNPRTFARRPHKYPEHYDAWLLFRGHLVAEKYALIRQTFLAAVEETGVKTTPFPWVQAYIGGGPVIGLHSNRALSEVLDYVGNMDYSGARVLRDNVARLAPETGDKLLMTISPGYIGSPEGDARSQVLEVVMGGSQGVHVWCYHIGTDTGHMVDMAEAIGMLVPVEDVILDGTVEGGYECDRGSVELLARKKGDTTALLVSDYSPDPGPATVAVPGSEELDVTDLFTGEVVARMNADQRSFSADLRRTFTARLYRLQPPAGPQIPGAAEPWPRLPDARSSRPGEGGRRRSPASP